MDTKEKRRSAPVKDTKAATTGTRRTASTSRSATAAPRKRSAPAAAQKRRSAAPKKPVPEVVYTQPGPFNKNRFLLQLVSVVAVVLALVFGMSIFFKVKVVTVSGVDKYTEWDIRQASGIQDGENLLGISEPKISSSIKAKLPYVNKVRVGIKLPDTVKIEIEELDVVYAVEADDSSWWLMRSDGGIVEKTNSAEAAQHTKVLGLKITNPEVGEKAVAAQPQTGEDESTPVTVLASEQLSVAVSILQYLEESGIIGEAASVDVSNLNSLVMWYGERFQIYLGDNTQLLYKIGLIKTTISEHMEPYDSGILDASLSIQPDPNKEYQVIYTPFDK